MTSPLTGPAAVILAAALVVAGCSNDHVLTEPAGTPQAAKSAVPLKVSPARLELAGIGQVTTLTASSTASPTITVEVSTPTCVSVAARPGSAKKFTVTSTAAGNCTLTVRDGVDNAVQVPVTVVVLQQGTLANGSFHTCGLTSGGVAYCWGWHLWGQLGTTTPAPHAFANPIPVAVEGNLTFTVLSAGAFHTCGLTGTGAAYCWGRNDKGQLGFASNSGTETPNPVPTPVNTSETFVAITTGSFHTCGLTGTGAVYCWGSNSNGQLGRVTDNMATLASVNPIPAPMDGSVAFAAITAGSDHTCGRTATGTAFCWGKNQDGQVGSQEGLGEFLGVMTTPHQLGVSAAFTSVVAGGAFTCGLVASGAAYCWGNNRNGELGTVTGTPTPNPDPFQVEGGHTFVSLAIGAGHGCGLTSTGTAYCWGSNLLGQLGNEGTSGSTFNPAPALVSGPTFVTLTAKGPQTCGVTATGSAWCWGHNRYGNLGTTTNNDTDTPTPALQAVSGGLSFLLP